VPQRPSPPPMPPDPRPSRAEPITLVAPPDSNTGGNRVLTLSPLRDGEATQLGRILATMDPWAAYRFPPERLTSFLAAEEPDPTRWAIRVDDALAGAVVIRHVWLHGPYLQFLAVLPDYQGAGLGAAVLRWMIDEAQGNARNVWLCVTGTNERAQAFYRRHGFEAVATFDGLVADGMDEILMRRRLG
jgi:ribosomal protein S18 acetylase RimI-like enzyme